MISLRKFCILKFVSCEWYVYVSDYPLKLKIPHIKYTNILYISPYSCQYFILVASYCYNVISVLRNKLKNNSKREANLFNSIKNYLSSLNQPKKMHTEMSTS